VQPTYNKSQLLAFGEYLPFGETFPFLYKLVPFVGTFERGPGPVTQNVPLVSGKLVKLGPQICYESLDPEFSRELAQGGSEIIFNVTNDSWFGDWAEPYQHLYMTLARGIENRRPLVRGTNTGISSVILANGTVMEQSKMNERWMQNFSVGYQQNPELTFYTRWGHWDWTILVLALFFIIYRSKRPRKNSRRK
jgi:apolipoprotein N-acyltransferase